MDYSNEPHYLGRLVAERHANQLDFDVEAAIASFYYDPPDSPFQQGYLKGLLKCGYATTK